MKKTMIAIGAALFMTSTVLLTGCSCLCGNTPDYFGPSGTDMSYTVDPTATLSSDATPSASVCTDDPEETCSGWNSASYFTEYIGDWANTMPDSVPQPAQGLSGNASSMISNDEVVYYRAATDYLSEETIQSWLDDLSAGGWSLSTEADAPAMFKDKLDAATGGIQDSAEDGQIAEPEHKYYTYSDGSLLEIAYGSCQYDSETLTMVVTYLNNAYA